MKPLWAKFKELPSPLQKQIVQRIGLGVAMLALFGVIWGTTGTLGLAVPGLALACYLLGSGGLIYHRCVHGEYLCMTGTVRKAFIVTSESPASSIWTAIECLNE